MQTATNTNRFFIDVFSFNRWADLHKGISPGEFYQQIASEIIKGVYAKEALSELASRLINLAERAYTLRLMDTVEQASQILLSLPLQREVGSVAHYYQALCMKRRGRFPEARTLLERVAEEAPIRYRARAIQSIGAIAFDSGDYQSALPLCIEASHAISHSRRVDPLAAVYIHHMIAMLRSADGDHQGALKDLETMFPLVRAVSSSYRPLYHNYRNSLSVEMIEVGRLEEAGHINRTVLASPYATAYPEWRETGNEIALRGYRLSRSVLSFNQRIVKPDDTLKPIPPDVGFLPKRDRSRVHAAYWTDIYSFQQRKEKMVKEPNGNQKDEEMDDRDVFMEIMRLSSQEGMTSKKLWKILEAVKKISSESEED